MSATIEFLRTPDERFASLPGYAFTPDGAALVYGAGGGIRTLDLESGEDRAIPFTARVSQSLGPALNFPYRLGLGPVKSRLLMGPELSPDGTRLAFSSFFQLHVYDLESGTLSSLTPQTDANAGGKGFHPAWSPDGRELAYVSWSSRGGHLWRVRANGRGKPQRVSESPGFYSDPAWSPDGKRILALRAASYDRLYRENDWGWTIGSDLVWFEPRGGRANLIAPSRGYRRPHFGPESDRVYLYHGRSGLSSMRFDGTDRRNHLAVKGPGILLRDEEVAATDVRLSPDGTHALALHANQLHVIRLLNPHLILQEILADPTIVSEADEQLLDGSVHHRLVVADEVAPITLYVNAATGHISKLATMENDHLRRDVPLEAFYYNWQPLEEGLVFPAELYLALDGEIIHKEIRSAIGVNQTFDPALFEIPAEVSPEFDADLAARGEASSQFNQLFAANGFIKDGAQTEINPEEIAPGIFHLTGVANNSMIIEQADGIVVVEAPLHQARSEAVIDWIKTTFPDKPISHVLSTHHHTDHSAGLRSYVAEGATVVLHEAAVPFFEDVFQAESEIMPDALAANPVEATIEAVPADGSLTIPDELQPVEVYPVENTHAEDMVLFFVPNEGVVFVSDLYSPNPGAEPGPGGQAIYETIVDAGLEVSLVAGGHGTTIPFEEFEALLSAE